MAVEFGYEQPSQQEIRGRLGALAIEELRMNLSRELAEVYNIEGQGTMSSREKLQDYLYDTHMARFDRIRQSIIDCSCFDPD